jgi:PAS domain S-box-containing protein
MPFERNRYRSSACVNVRELLAVRQTGSATELGNRGVTEDIVCSGYPLRLPGGEVMGVLAIFAREAVPRDDSTILESVAHATSQAIHNARVAESLQASQKHAQRDALKLRTMIEGMAEGVVVADSHDIITDVNAWFLEKTHLQRDAIVGKSLWDFHPHTAGSERVRAAIDDFRHGRRTDTYVTHRNLLGMYLALRAQPIFSNDTYRGIILNVIDVSDIERAREVAVSADRAKSQFLANMSHEIRTPMTAILGFTDILLDQIDVPDALETAQAIRRNGEQLLALMQNVLDISQIESGRLGVEHEDWPPRQIVADVGALMSVRSAAKGLTLSIENDEQLPPFITTDPIRLRQILTNLVGNAIKFTNHGGVHLSTQVVPSEDGTASLQFHVTDTGIGIETSDLERIFEAFTQVDATASRRYEGTGLGLAISRQLATALGGELTVRSTPGLGSTFTLTLHNVATPDHETTILEDNGDVAWQATSANLPLVPPNSTETRITNPAEATG